jgi:hypothetical protein
MFVGVLALIGCNINEISPSKTGSIELAFTNNVKARGFVPEYPMEISRYEISGSGPSDAKLEPFELDGHSTLINDLAPGTWEITVTGYNNLDKAIGEGVVFVSVIAGYTQSKTVFIEEIGGEGSFSLSLELPEDDPSIDGIKLDFYREHESMFSRSFTSDQFNELEVDPIESGFYALAVKLYRGEMEVWGQAYSLRIVAGQDTTGEIRLSSEDLATYGGIDLSIIDNMPVLFDVGLTSNKDIVGDGESVTFTAEPNDGGGNYSYWWFVDGSRLDGKGGKTLTLTDELDIGVYNVSVIAIRAGVMASASKSIIKNNDPVEMPEGVTINGVYLYPEEIQQILSDLNLTELPTETGLLLLSPNTIQSPQSGEILPYSFDIEVFGPGVDLAEISLPQGMFSTFVPIDTATLSNTEFTIKGTRIENGSNQDEFYYRLMLSDESPTIFWLDVFESMGSTKGYLENIESSGMRGLIRSTLPLTSTNEAALTVSDFYTPDGYIESVIEEYWNGIYRYVVLMKSDYVNADQHKNFTIYAKPSIMVDGKRSLGDRIITSQYLTHLMVPSIPGVQYQGLDNTILTDGYYVTHYQAFSLMLDENLSFAGWESGTFFKELSSPMWPNGQEYPDTQALPSPIVVTDSTPIITACYVDRSIEQQGNTDLLVDSPLTTETLKVSFSEPVISSGNASITADNFVIEGATITNITHTGDEIDVTISGFEPGPFSLEIIDLVTVDGNASIEGQSQFKSDIVELIISNDNTYGSVSDHAGLYFKEETVKITVTPFSNFRVTRLNDPYGYYGNQGSKKGEQATFWVRFSDYEEDWTYTISPQYE